MKQLYSFAKNSHTIKIFILKHNDLVFSKLGLGTLIKNLQRNYVFHYIEVLKEAIKSGINLIDTASNYRYGQSEKRDWYCFKRIISRK